MSEEIPVAAPPPASGVSPPGPGATTEPAPRRISTTHDPAFPRILAELGASLLVSTYQTGRVAAVRARGEDLLITYHKFDHPMGIAVSRERIAIGTRSQSWFIVGDPQIARAIDEGRRYDACYIARGSHITGEIHGHEMAWSGRELFVVNTLFSCLCSIGGGHHFIPRWKPRFVSTLAAEDRCHLNGLALEDGRPRYLTCLGETDTERGWRAGKAAGGCVIDVPTGQPVLRGLSMPHSPRVHRGRLWFLESGRGRLVAVDQRSGSLETVAELPGYARGLLAGLRAVVPLRPAPAGTRSASAWQAFGGVGIARPGAHAPAGELSELLLHEFQHIKLNVLLDLQQLVQPGSRARFPVPWKGGEHRPPEAALHGSYAFLALVHLRRAEGPASRATYHRYRSWVGRVTEDLLRATDVLTAAGQRFVGGMAAAAESGVT